MIARLSVRLGPREVGASIVEAMVAMLVSGMVVAILLTGYVSAGRAELYTDHDAQALSVLRSATAQFGRELRQARKVYADSTSRKIRFWVDYDRDNQQEASERITWELESTIDGGRLVRKLDTGDQTFVRGGLLVKDAFVYSPAPIATTVVEATFVADVDPDRLAAERRIKMEVRLRNASHT